MDPISVDAIRQLEANVTALLPAIPVNFTRYISIVPKRIIPSGLGGFIGVHDNPVGQIVGRKVDAVLTVHGQSSNFGTCISGINQVATQLSSLSRATLTTQGILKLSVKEVGAVRSATIADGGLTSQQLDCDILYEYRSIPVESEYLIETIALDTIVASGSNKTGVIFSNDFSTDPMALFTVVDDPLANKNVPSNWVYSQNQGRIEQRKRTYGGSRDANYNKPGTYLLLNTAPEASRLDHFLMRATLRSEDQFAIGCVFRWQDADNFYFFLMDYENHYRFIGKKIQGLFQALDIPAFDSEHGYEQSRNYQVKVVAVENRFDIYIDEIKVLSGIDNSIRGKGSIGFMSFSNNRSFFNNIILVKL